MPATNDSAGDSGVLEIPAGETIPASALTPARRGSPRLPLSQIWERGPGGEGLPRRLVRPGTARFQSAFRLLPYLRLVRAPAVFSALGDPLAGAVIAGGRLSPGRAADAAVAAGALYLGGMALNDVADHAADARERPERPIPSGAVSVRAAAVLGGALLLAGTLAARRAGAGRSGRMLAGTILAYDFALKCSALFGPLAMGACRALSLRLGAEAAGGAWGAQRATGAASLLGAYVAGLTVLARGEVGGYAPRTAVAGAALSGVALLSIAARGGSRSLPWAAVAVALAGPAVGAMIRVIPALDAALAAPCSPRRAATLGVPLLALSRWGRHLVPIT